MAKLKTIDRISPFAKAVTYLLLSLVGVSMVIPFLWMVVTAVKPMSQVDKLTWIPYREYVDIDDVSVEVLGRSVVGQGRYEVRVVRGDLLKGRTLTVDTATLTAYGEWGSDFVYTPAGQQDVPAERRQTYGVKLVRIVEPRQIEVRFMAGRLTADDVSDWRALVNGVLRHVEVERSVRENLPDEAPKEPLFVPLETTLKALPSEGPIPEPAGRDLLARLNAILGARDMYSTSMWKGVPLYEEAKRLLEKGLDGLSEDELRGFNRYIMVAAWPDALKRAAATVDETAIDREPSLYLENFPRTIAVADVFGRSFINSIFISLVITIGQITTCSLAAFAFARLSFKGRDVLFMGYLATLMIPGAVTMIPLFVILKAIPDVLNTLFQTTWFSSAMYFTYQTGASTGAEVGRFYLGKVVGLDSYFAMVAPGLFSAYGTFMLRQFFMSIPRDLEDAAFIDGCSLFGVYRNVALPLSTPALATLGIFTFMGSWRQFIWPLVVTSTPDMQTVFVMLSTFQGVKQTEWNLLMAGTLMVIAPMIFVFLAGQRFFIEGIQLGGVKG